MSIAAILSGLAGGVTKKTRRWLKDGSETEEDEVTEERFKLRVGSRVPDREECIFLSEVFKQKSCAAISKEERKTFGGTKVIKCDAYLTDSALILSKPSSKVQVDLVMLEDITKVSEAHNQGIRPSDIGGAGTLVLRARMVSDTAFSLEAAGQTLANSDGLFGTSDPFLRVLLNKDSKECEIMKSKVITNNLNPSWGEMLIETETLCSSATGIQIQCWDSGRDHDTLIGLIQVSLGELLTGDQLPRTFPLMFDKLVQRGGSSEVNMLRPQHPVVHSERSFCVNEQSLWCFHVHTNPDGHSCGNMLVLYTTSSELRSKWVLAIEEQRRLLMLAREAAKYGRYYKIRHAQARLKHWFDSAAVQGLMACIIGCAFVTNVLNAEWAGNGDATVFEAFEMLYTYVFTAELLVNFLANFWCGPFILNPKPWSSWSN